MLVCDTLNDILCIDKILIKDLTYVCTVMHGEGQGDSRTFHPFGSGRGQ